MPIYPFELRKKGIPGYAVIEFIVDVDGNVRDPWVVEATVKEFGYAAIGCVSQWKFEPGRKAGRKVNTRMKIPIYFDFNDAAQAPSNASGKPEPPAPPNASQ
jgi:TonB family protein